MYHVVFHRKWRGLNVLVKPHFFLYVTVLCRSITICWIRDFRMPGFEVFSAIRLFSMLNLNCRHGHFEFRANGFFPIWTIPYLLRPLFASVERPSVPLGRGSALVRESARPSHIHLFLPPFLLSSSSFICNYGSAILRDHLMPFNGPLRLKRA